jgi:hypothetical protein
MLYSTWRNMAVNTTARDIPRMMPANLWENRIATESIAGVAITEVAVIPNGILPTSPEEDKRRRWCLLRQLTGHATVLLSQQLPFLLRRGGSKKGKVVEVHQQQNMKALLKRPSVSRCCCYSPPIGKSGDRSK